MRAQAIAVRSSESDERNLQTNDSRPSLLTPARRAALEALEREFSELLRARARR